ncbi:putative DCC family thiol-disulfide oxidoreductase YuxK [Streptacidiphilus sp. MAP12-20]
MGCMEITAGTPVLVYDGDCAFCTSSLRTAERVLGTDGWASIPFQFADLDALGKFTAGAVTPERVEREIVWITPSGKAYGGAAAAARLLLRTQRLPWNVLGAVALLPGVRVAMAALYRLVAVNRHRLPGGTPACALPR